ncbi:anthranilate 1,2-dioxygenase small subunit [Variovorax saccharolyticus]|uniref:anthranilate 1,2-dioxygenase small subunit n=1 Tax=Variovorax saccharolyticus TaxID=3053516 RepID=UPI002578976B|nr:MULTISPECIES: anthranilate 1,2-dioxygenase small subunit [unclassified Variovorax]MDM0021492.1 anthranilate 1,2-dioxygenase small subunit [Variovorax sp. J22R187]MDM0027498.1 anthranilate 1,2-dioxygenase small subunit [Variovorax sp. J31P216]
MTGDLQQSVEQFLYRKADLCDRREWVDYLELFDEESELHIPQWDSEHVYTTDPKRGMSLMYYANRAGLEDRVFRIGTGKSAASTPMPRTLHLVTNVAIQEVSDSQLEAKAKWVTHVYRFGQSSTFHGDVTYRLRPAGFSWVILKKHVVIHNDTIDSVLDFYHV